MDGYIVRINRRTGLETLQLAYGSAVITIFSLDGLFSGDLMIDKGKNIILKGG